MSESLFTLEGKRVIPRETCYIIEPLHQIIRNYPDNYIDVLAYCMFMTCPNAKLNPFFDSPDETKSDDIIASLASLVYPESDEVQEAIEFLKKHYDTPTKRLYEGMKSMMDKLANFFSNTGTVTTGRDGSLNQIVTAMKSYESIRKAFKSSYQELQEEQGAGRRRGDKKKAYDM